MSIFLYIIVAFVVAAVATVVVMPWLLHLCYKRELFDLPESRKIHKNNIPRLGGIIFAPAAFIGLVAAIALASIEHPESFNKLSFGTLYVACGALIVYLIGVFDDLLGCSARLKFIVQIAAACTFPFAGLYIDSLYGFMGIYEIPLWVSWLLTIFLTLLIVNALNLIDGIDGLAAGISLIALACYGVLFGMIDAKVFTYLCASLAGTLCVFLGFNLFGKSEKHTKTFMGDSGSLLLGICLAYFTMKYAMHESVTLIERPDGLLMAYTLLLVPCFDLCRVALCRLRRHRGIFEPDKTHLHHKFMAKGLTMHQTLVCILILQLLFVLLNRAMFAFGLGLEWIVLADIVVYSALNIYLPVGMRAS